MPELPEVETVVRGLEKELTGRTILHVHIDRPLVVKSPLTVFSAGLIGKKVAAISRHGKAIFWTLSDNTYVKLHLGMSGSLLFRPKNAPPDPYVRVWFELDDSKSNLAFRDVRQFGRVALAREPREKNWGPDAWKATSREIFLAIRKKRGMIKHALMNQNVIAGLGNIYVDESLHAAKIHPKKKIERLKDQTLQNLCSVVKDVLRRAIQARGTSFRDYVNTAGERGDFKGLLKVYGHKGKPCFVCGTPIRKIVVASRGTHFCPSCQIN